MVPEVCGAEELVDVASTAQPAPIAIGAAVVGADGVQLKYPYIRKKSPFLYGDVQKSFGMHPIVTKDRPDRSGTHE